MQKLVKKPLSEKWQRIADEMTDPNWKPAPMKPGRKLIPILL